ncbi:hypothetical protein JOC94_004219 [Bacillus thermophilus]|uniref:Uncharacterized protein n=1 Tax=Siminovitchia thermophila TaxID=1245522 RepID=A0ABS2RC81_9BACI|nr:hypothetical protein [Siminovitchia thermophila]MBM7717194.1 hypothetical protein [Siminovitchia thermophila]
MAETMLKYSPSGRYLAEVIFATDANVYSARATSVDISGWCIEQSFTYTYYYNLVIERYNGRVWLTMQQWTGHFKRSIPTKRFMLKGKPAGNYRITVYINIGCRNCGKTYINRSGPFLVRR